MLETMTAPAEIDEVDVPQTEAELQAEIAARKREAADSASTVDDIGAQFKREMEALVERSQRPTFSFENAKGSDGASASDGLSTEQIKAETTKHVHEMTKASKETGGISVMHDDPSHLGVNRVGGGRDSMRLNADMWARLDGTGVQIKQIQHTYWHEFRHGMQVAAPIELLEGDAERFANEKVGMSREEHREGQPTELYGTGQDMVGQLERIVGREAVDRGLTKDLEILEEAIVGHVQETGDETIVADLPNVKEWEGAEAGA